MNSLRKIIQESITLAENIQQADKIYFKTGLLTPEDKEEILKITGGDNYTRLVADWAYHLTKIWKEDLNGELAKTTLAEFYHNLKEYNKNVFPVDKDLFYFNAQTNERGKHILDLFSMLRERQKAVKALRELPTFAIDNLKKFIREPRSNEYYFKDIAEKLRLLNRDIKSLPGPGRWDDEEAINRKQLRRDSLLKKYLLVQIILTKWLRLQVSLLWDLMLEQKSLEKMK